MGNEKFVNYYIEGLISTLNDCLIRNISLQANERISKEAIEQLEKVSKNSILENERINKEAIEEHVNKIESLNGTIDALKTELESAKKQQNLTDNERYQNLENSIKDHLNTIGRLNGEVSQLNSMKSEYENIKHQVQHVDTFRTELNKTREELNNVRNDYEKRIADLTSSHELKITELNTIHSNHEKTIADLTNSYELKIGELNEKIDHLQLTPAKKKKIEDVKKEIVETPIGVLIGSENILKDGGSF